MSLIINKMPYLKTFGKDSEPVRISAKDYNEAKEFYHYKVNQILEDYRANLKR